MAVLQKCLFCNGENECGKNFNIRDDHLHKTMNGDEINKQEVRNGGKRKRIEA